MAPGQISGNAHAASAGLSDPLTEERVGSVDAARNEWIGRLVDLSRRNNLLYFRELRVGTLDLSGAPREALQALLQSGRTSDDAVPLSDFFARDDELTRPGASLKQIWARAVSNFEEKGLDTLFLAVALAEWKASDEGRNTSAPVLLVPIEVKPAGVRSAGWTLRRAGDIKINDVLIHALEAEHGVTIVADDLLPLIRGDDEGEALDLWPVFSQLAQLARSVPEFNIEDRWVLGNFAFQKMAIVKDLRELASAMARHNLVAGIAGCDEARNSARGSGSSGESIEIDRVHPDNEFLILDADSSQQRVISLAVRGQNGVISGPPGTGKSQTIANLIAEMISRGKTVLFVAEKRAALDVVKSRLAEVGLSHLCLDCHGAETTRRMIAEQLSESFTIIRDATMPDSAHLHERLVEKRERLNQHVESLHSPRLAAGLSLFQMYGQLLRLPPESRAEVRLERTNAQRIKRGEVEDSCELLREAASHADLFVGGSASPWKGAVFATAESMRSAITAARSLASGRWAVCEAALAMFIAETGGESPATVGGLRRIAEVLGRLQDLRTRCSEDVFTRPLTSLAASLSPASSTPSRWWAALTSSRFRAAVTEVRQFSVAGRISSLACRDTVATATSLLIDWRLATGAAAPPRWSTRFDELLSAWENFAHDLQQVIAQFPSRRFDDTRMGDLGRWLRALSADLVTPAQILRIQEIERRLTDYGFRPVIVDIRTRKPRAEVWVDLLMHAWLATAIEEVQLTDPVAASFQGRRHDEIAREFVRLDEDRLELAVQRVRRAHAQAAISARNRFPKEDQLVSREAQRKTRHLPLRRLFADAPNVLLGLRPCWMASPLSVSQLIPGDRPHFDVVVFDEASQVLPEDAVTSLLRGRQAVVAGDRRQLPPTTFFAAGDSESTADEDGATAGFESILDVMTAFLDPSWSLDWHYRSRDEALIAYSNHRIYGGRLVTFPGPGLREAVSHVLVPHLPGQAGQDESASPEVQRVVELVVEHARTRPNETLGVIAMGMTHAKRIEMEFERVRQLFPELDGFFAQNRSERFFIKNLERVQGDERDAIILSVGYGKNEAGKLVYRFGPLNQDGGERRLNVAITRARRRMTVVSSFSHHDVDPTYPREGVKHLRNYLEYAATGGKSFGLTGGAESVPLNEFEQAIHDELTRRGLRLLSQVGSSNYRIDLVAVHPEKPGRFVLAIECDGASYHSAPSARDRDRLRQQQLEAIGWKFCRIWSTDWFLRREEEVQRVLAAFEKARRQVDAEDAGREGMMVNADRLTIAPPTVSQSPAQRGPMPRLSGRPNISNYAIGELVTMVRWVASDGRLRTDEELLAETVEALGFARRGSRIVERVSDAIRLLKSLPDWPA